jgi:hypothetical protein
MALIGTKMAMTSASGVTVLIAYSDSSLAPIPPYC